MAPHERRQWVIACGSLISYIPTLCTPPYPHRAPPLCRPHQHPSTVVVIRTITSNNSH
ncbi:hypothetical protein BDN67DRAFT_968407 [Paxillus ammoniavirescens]|nr:hypothetical protein BDN67DRAFT_968407 [Paxillus ammoniavirescens]